MKTLNSFLKDTKKTMLIDSDLLAYKVTSSLEEPIDWGHDQWTLHCDFAVAKQLFAQSIHFYPINILTLKTIKLHYFQQDKVRFRYRLAAFDSSCRPVACLSWVCLGHQICHLTPKLKCHSLQTYLNWSFRHLVGNSTFVAAVVVIAWVSQWDQVSVRNQHYSYSCSYQRLSLPSSFPSPAFVTLFKLSSIALLPQPL